MPGFIEVRGHVAVDIHARQGNIQQFPDVGLIINNQCRKIAHHSCASCDFSAKAIRKHVPWRVVSKLSLAPLK